MMMQQKMQATAPPSANSEEFELQIEQMFDKADDLMINQENYVEAVSLITTDL